MTTQKRFTLVDDLLKAMEEGDVLEVFSLLPLSDQENFARWIDKAHDDDSRWRRLEALVLAMRMSPLQPRQSRFEVGLEEARKIEPG